MSKKIDIIDQWIYSDHVFNKDLALEYEKRYSYLSKYLASSRFDFSLDLHYFTVVRAIDALEKFILDCTNYDDIIVRVIHGKGNNSRFFPKLKYAVSDWFESSDYDFIKIYTLAARNNGGEGATMVWINNLY